jgi:hypothetical protein
LSHTLNLELQDILRECFPGCDPVAGPRSILDALPTAKWGDEFHGVPTGIKTGWLSVGEVVNYIAARSPKIQQLFSNASLTRGSPARAGDIHSWALSFQKSRRMVRRYQSLDQAVGNPGNTTGYGLAENGGNRPQI